MENKLEVTQEKYITDEVLEKVNSLNKKGDLVIPKGYSAANALKSAWVILQDTCDREKHPALQVCTRASIANALLDMVIQGLSPAKKQCYFVVYGKKLQLMRSYMGTVAVTKRLKNIVDVKAYCIYEGDEFETEYNIDTATIKITKFKPQFENIDITKIKGAFAVVLGENGPIHTEIMNINQIKKAWGQGTAFNSGKSTAHNAFTDEMAKKTVTNRACKMYANTSDDSDVLIEAFNNSDDKIIHDEKDIVKKVAFEVKQEIENNANIKPIDIVIEEAPADNKQQQIDIDGPAW